VQLLGGLTIFGFSLGLMLEAHLGLGSWDVLHQGIAERLGVGIGWVVIGVGAVTLAAWLALGERAGVGTVANVVLVGIAVDASVAVLSTPATLPVRIAFLLAGIVLNAVATGLYIGAGLGPGPRDGLMTAFAARGHSLRAVRTVIELTVLAAGVLLGGEVGPGTLLFAVAIGPLTQFFLPRLTIPWSDR
jgi:uncharacterized membrane protein YczE